MSNLTNRIKQLEKSHTPQVNKFLCIYYADETKNPDGYKVQPNRGEPFHLPSLAALDEFGGRADVDLTKIVIQYTSEQPISTYTSGDYSFSVGVDMNEI